jgi:hypothetical protein
MNTIPRKLIALLVALAALAAIGLSACGDDSDGDDGSLSKDEFISQADEICATGDAELDEAGQAYAATGGKQTEELITTVIVPGYRDQLEQLNELDPPEEDQAQIQEFLDTFERGVDMLEANPDQVLNGKAFGVVVEAREIAQDYGMQACARGAFT